MSIFAKTMIPENGSSMVNEMASISAMDNTIRNLQEEKLMVVATLNSSVEQLDTINAELGEVVKTSLELTRILNDQAKAAKTAIADNEKIRDGILKFFGE